MFTHAIKRVGVFLFASLQIAFLDASLHDFNDLFCQYIVSIYTLYYFAFFAIFAALTVAFAFALDFLTALVLAFAFGFAFLAVVVVFAFGAAFVFGATLDLVAGDFFCAVAVFALVLAFEAGFAFAFALAADALFAGAVLVFFGGTIRIHLTI